jgi:hypothetical protein
MEIRIYVYPYVMCKPFGLWKGTVRLGKVVQVGDKLAPYRHMTKERQ